MKALSSVLTVAALSLLVVAHDGDNLEARRHYARQASTTSSQTSSQASSSHPSTSGPASSTSANPTVTVATSTSSTSNISVSLLATNPTAVPLSAIVSTESSLPVPTLTTSETPGPGPSSIPGAPSLPDISNFNVQNYPPWDVTPPTDSPEVQQWIQDVINTGVLIPGLSPTNPGGCPNNTQITNPSDPNVCWWYCGGCTKPIDITVCPQTLNWGLTYDDGPAYYTPNLLQFLDANQLKSTFFVVGSRCAQFPNTVRDEYMNGHQLAVHTWSHPMMTTLSNEQIIAELGWTKKIIKDLTGVTPNTWRPPYGDIDNRVRTIAAAMGLRPVIWTHNFDTGDYYVKGGTVTAPQVLQNWVYIMGNVTQLNTGFIVLEHDLFEQSVQLATGYILPDALAVVPKFTISPVITCLNMPLANAYIETNDNDTNPPPLSESSYVTTSHVASSTGTTSHSSSDPRFSVGFSLMFIMTIVTLLASVYAVRF